ncbi:MAG: hypothetical protein HXY51_00980 [Nitrospirae bacterium]|nr:hypothetical protein [Nitrospirota bacterium]
MKLKIPMVALGVGLWAMGLLVAPAAKAVSLDFNIGAPTAGTVSYAGGSTALIGTGIEVDNVVGLGTPANSNVTSVCLSCVLNFNTGTLISAGGPPSSGSNNGWWSFGSSGSVTITGGVDLQGTTTDIALGSTLLNGTFNSAFVQDLGTQGFKVTFGTFSDTKHPDLLTYYGLTAETPFQGAFTLLFASPNPGTGGAFTSTSIFSGNVVNTVDVAPVPLPGAVLLFGSGLMGLVPMLRRYYSAL